MAAPKALFLALVLLAMAAGALAYPALFVDNDGQDDCQLHPTAPDGKHGAPQADPTTSFVVRDAAGSVVKAVCPGKPYTVTISFPQVRYLLATAGNGSILTTDSPAPTAEAEYITACPSRYVFGEPGPRRAQNNYTLDYTLPAGATKGDAIAVTSATGPTSNFLNANLNLPLAPGSVCTLTSAAANATAAAANATAGVTEAISNATAGVASAISNATRPSNGAGAARLAAAGLAGAAAIAALLA